MLMVSNSFVAITLNSFLLPITEEVRVGTGQALVLCITINLNKNRALLLKC